MKLSIIHPEEDSIGALESAIVDGDCVYRSPHVGNVNNSELSLMFGLSEMGAMVQVELVDSIRGDDRYSRPQVALIGDSAITLASRNSAKSRVVGGCEPKPEAVDELIALGVKVDTELSPTLRSLHVGSLEQAVPESVSITVSSEYFATMGQMAYKMVLEEAQKVVDRPLRNVDSQGKPREVSGEHTLDNIYGLGDNPGEGLLPPLEAMMAMEVVKKLIDNNSQDGQIVHVAGPDMIRYTREDGIMGRVETIAQNVLSGLAIGRNTSLEYVVPCMKTVVESGEFNGVIDSSVQSQYDMLVADKE